MNMDMVKMDSKNRYYTSVQPIMDTWICCTRIRTGAERFSALQALGILMFHAFQLFLGRHNFTSRCTATLTTTCISYHDSFTNKNSTTFTFNM